MACRTRGVSGVTVCSRQECYNLQPLGNLCLNTCITAHDMGMSSCITVQPTAHLLTSGLHGLSRQLPALPAFRRLDPGHLNGPPPYYGYYPPHDFLPVEAHLGDIVAGHRLALTTMGLMCPAVWIPMWRRKNSTARTFSPSLSRGQGRLSWPQQGSPSGGCLMHYQLEPASGGLAFTVVALVCTTPPREGRNAPGGAPPSLPPHPPVVPAPRGSGTLV